MNLILILVAEDEPDEHILAKMAFTNARIANQVIYVQNRVQALAAISADPRPGLVLINPFLEGALGLDLAAEIKRNYPGTIVILLISSDDEQDYCTQIVSVDGFLKLPFTSAELYEVLLSGSPFTFGVFG